MPERILFHFEGGLANEHKLNFYEAARFQYATARLVVKLSQFRQNGKFNKRINSANNTDIYLETHKDGSFDIGIIAPLLVPGYEAFINTSISTLMTYVFERIVGKSSDTEVTKAINSVGSIVEQFGKISDNDTEKVNRILDFVEKNQDSMNELHTKNSELYERLLAERDRNNLLESNSGRLAKIDPVREQKLISMSAPLVSEMATALRTSADTLQVISEDNFTGSKSNILFLNRKMASDIENDVVDKDLTAILGNIIQYNKELGGERLGLTYPIHRSASMFHLISKEDFRKLFCMLWVEIRFI